MLPAAINFGTDVYASKRNDRVVRACAWSFDGECIDIDLDNVDDVNVDVGIAIDVVADVGQRVEGVERNGRGKDAARGHDVALGRQLAATLGALRLGLFVDLLGHGLGHHRRRSHGLSR